MRIKDLINHGIDDCPLCHSKNPDLYRMEKKIFINDDSTCSLTIDLEGKIYYICCYRTTIYLAPGQNAVLTVNRNEVNMLAMEMEMKDLRKLLLL